MGQVVDALHATLYLVTILGVLRPLPLRKPVRGIRQPVGANPQSCRCRAWCLGAARLCQTHRVEGVKQLVGIHHLVHHVTHAFVCREVVKESVPESLRDTCLLRTASPVQHIMARAEAFMRTHVVTIHFAVMARHRHSHLPHLRATGAQEFIPQHSRRAEFCIVPRKAAHIIIPPHTFFRRHTGVHHVAVVEVSVPTIALHLLGIIVRDVIQLLVEVAAVVETPYSEGTLAVQILSRHDKLPVVRHIIEVLAETVYRLIVIIHIHHRSAGDAVCRAHAGLNILVCRLQGMRNGVIVRKVHCLRLWTPKTKAHRCAVTAGVVYLQRRRI